jgi:hypothetical protein
MALAREAARQWHPALEGDRLNTRGKTHGSVLKLFGDRDESDPGGVN